MKTLGRVDDLARLRERALALIRGFAVGDALGWDDVDESARIGSAGRAALGIARHVARLGRVDERALHRSILDGEAPLHVSDPSDTWIESRIGAQSVLAAGIARRPQDYNGLVDDAVSIVAIGCYTSTAIASGCAVAAFMAAMLDGWDMESGASLALAIAERGRTFGRKTGAAVLIDEIRAAILRVDDEMVNPAPDLDRAIARIAPLGPVPRALGLAYACRDAGEAITIARSFPEHNRLTAAVAGALAAAYRPESLPASWRARVEAQNDIDPADIADGLLAIRTSRWTHILR